MEQMTVDQVINLILSTYADALKYMIPIIAVMAGINWIVGFLIFTTPKLPLFTKKTYETEYYEVFETMKI